MDSEDGTKTRADAAPSRARARRLARGLVVLAPVLLVLVAFGIDRAVSSDAVLRGVWVGGTSLSGLPRDRVLKRVGELEARLSAAALPVRVAGKLEEVKPESVGFRVDVENTADAALAAGRAGSVVAQLGWWLARWVSPVHLAASVDSSPEALAALLDDLEVRLVPDRPFAGGVRRNGTVFLEDPPREGRRIDRERARTLLLNALAEESRGVVDLPLLSETPTTLPAVVQGAAKRATALVAESVTLVSEDGQTQIAFEPSELAGALRAQVTKAGREVAVDFDPIEVDKLLVRHRKEHESPPRDAEFLADERDRVSILPSRPGTLLSARRVAEALLAAASAPGRVGVLPILRGAAPEVTTEDLAKLGIKGLVSKFTTFHPCCQPRVDNIHRIADLVNGLRVQPDEIVSLNAAVGPRTTANGFVAAPTIEEGEMVDSLGGGVSQFATTFFNALFYGGYDILERAPHTYYFARYPMGHEATLSWPKPDIIFRNDTAAGMWIRCEYTDKSITVKIYGDNGGRKVRATKSGQFAITKPAIELLPNPDLLPDEEKVKEGGQIGWSIVVGREITFSDGTKKEEKRKVIYKPRVRRVEVHPCRIPEGEPGHTGQKCPVPEAGVDAGPTPELN